MKNGIQYVLKKPPLLIAAVIVGLGIIGGGGYWLVQSLDQYKQKITATRQANHEAAVKEVEKIAFRGDKEDAIAFVEKVKSGDTKGASRVYLDQVDAAATPAEKMSLYSQYGAFASEYELHDQALEAALGADKVLSSYSTLAEIARVYGLMGNTDKEIDYYYKAIGALEKNPNDPNNPALKAYYESLIIKAQDK